MTKTKKIIICVGAAIVLFAVGLIAGLNINKEDKGEQEAFSYAMTSNDMDVLQGYLDTYADAPDEHRFSIEQRLENFKIEKQQWEDAVVAGTKSALRDYMAKYPDTQYKQIAITMIDSLDWVSADRVHTVVAYEQYMDEHPSGSYYEAASDSVRMINTQTVQTEENIMIDHLFSTFFQSINNRDDDGLAATVSQILTSFLGKQDAIRADVITFMHKIYKDDVSGMVWRSNEDYKITKKEVGENQYEYSVSFSATQDVEMSDGTSVRNKYRVNAKVNPDWKIFEYGMTKLID